MSKKSKMVADDFESEVGVHLLELGGEPRCLLRELDMAGISEELHKLDWQSNFYQFVVVKEPGVSMEVGGSLDESDGLSAYYKNFPEKIEAVIVAPPKTVLEMEQILEAFLQPDEVWKTRYEFGF